MCHSIVAQGHDIVIQGVSGQRIRIFDVMGRMVAIRDESTEAERFRMMASGVYLVQVGDGAAQRVVVR